MDWLPFSGWSPIVAQEVNLTSGFDNLWSAVEGILGDNILGILTTVGVIIIIGSFLGWLWEKRSRSGQGGLMGSRGSGLMYSLGFGALLATPGLMRLAFLVFDGAVNAAINASGLG